MIISQTAADIAVTSPEGFTVNPRTGQLPDAGYMVAIPGHVVRVPAASVTAEIISDALSDDIFSQDDIWLGGWRDGDDIEIEPAVNVASRGDAMMLGRVWEQVSIWDVASARELDPRTGLARAA